MRELSTMGRLADMSPKTKAKLVGVLLLITMVGVEEMGSVLPRAGQSCQMAR